MASLERALHSDPTLDAVDRAIERREAEKPYRSQRLGMSSVGGSCQRLMWYNFRWAFKEALDATSIKRFEDGYHAEDLMAERLRLLPDITLVTHDPETGKQFVYLDQEGHAKGKPDGKITGILQAPKKLHIWEHKSVSEKKFNELKKAVADLGEKSALKKWNLTYYGQAQLYMYYEGTDRHYMTVSTPGGRDYTGIRTEYDVAYATQLRARMGRIIRSEEPLDRVSNKPDWFECRRCPARGICHEGEMPDRTCRTCLHVTPIADGQWHCERFGINLTAEQQQAGCAAHKFLPSLVPGEVVDATDTGVTYRLPDGSTWYDGEDSAK